MRFDLWYEHAVLTQPATLNVSLNWNWSPLLKACNLKHLITNYPEIKLFKISIEQGAFLNTYLVSLLQRPQRFFKVFIELPIYIYIYIPQKLSEFRVRKARAMVCLSIFVFLSIIKESYVVPTMLPDTVRYEIQWNNPENLFEAGKKNLLYALLVNIWVFLLLDISGSWVLIPFRIIHWSSQLNGHSLQQFHCHLF